MCLLTSLAALQHDEEVPLLAFWEGEALPIPLAVQFAVPAIAGEEWDAGVPWSFSGEAVYKTDASDGKATLDSNSV